MSLKAAFQGLFGKSTSTLRYALEGTETRTYHQVEKVMDELQGLAAALTLYHLKEAEKDKEHPPEFQAMYDYTDGMSREQVDERFNFITGLMTTLNGETKESFHADGSVEISKHGVLLNYGNRDIGFPYQGTTQPFKGGGEQYRIAVQEGTEIHLRLVVGDGVEIGSSCEWIIDRASGQISFTLKEARYEQVESLGRVMLNQIIEASGPLI